MALCSLSTGRMAVAALPRRLDHQRAGHDEHFLVRERECLARVDRGQSGFEACRSGRCAKNQIDVRVRRSRDQPFSSDGKNLEVGLSVHTCGELLARGVRGHAHRAWTKTARPARQGVMRSRPRRARRSRADPRAPRRRRARSGQSNRWIRAPRCVSSSISHGTRPADRRPARRTGSCRAGRGRRRALESAASCPSRRRRA